MQSLPYFAYRSFWKEDTARREFYARGFRQFVVFPSNTTNSLGEPYNQYPPVWKWFGKYDWAPLDRQIDDLLKVAPDARILFMVDLNSPLWLVRQWSGCTMQWSDSFSNVSGCLAMPEWRKATAEYLDALLDYTQQKYGDRILCYILMCGVTDEWMDYSAGAESESKLERYREWSRQKGYPEPAGCPDFAHRFAAPHPPQLRDPLANLDARRYWEFHSDLIADGLIAFAAQTRKHLRTGQQIGAFFGYVMELTNFRLVQSGHLSYEKVLSSGQVNFLISPGDYGDREMGGGAGFMNLNGSLHLHHVGYLHEIDHRTHTANMKLTPYVELTGTSRWNNQTEDIAGLRREFCRSLFHGANLWWFDMWGGFYVEKPTLDAIGQMLQLWKRFANAERQPDAEIAIFVDPASLLYINDHSPENDITTLLPRLQHACNRLGTPFLLQDISDLERLPRAPKLAILPEWIELTAEKRTLLTKALPQTRLLWLGPCGLTDGANWQQELPGQSIPAPEAFTTETIREAAEQAGVHFYADALITVWAAPDLLSAHSKDAQTVHFRLRRKAHRIVECFSQTEVAADTSEFTWQFPGPQTVLFSLEY